MATTPTHDLMANAIRFLAVDAVEKAKSGHPGLPMGAADVATVLWRDVLKFDAADPHWPDRDRFVLSAGHGSMMLYALAYLTGLGGDKGLTIDDLEAFRQVGSKTPGHPEYGHTVGVETTTGPLGQGIGNAVGMAIAERMMAAQFTTNIVDHRTYVIASDGDLMEGVSQEAIAIAGHLRLSKLIVFYDDNGISIDGHTSLSDSVDQVTRFRSAGWNSSHIDGHDVEAIRKAIQDAQASDRPTMIACKTTIGFGSPHRQGTQKAHSDAFGPDEVAATRKNLDWPYPPFEIPDDILSAWRDAGARGAAEREAWLKRLAELDNARRSEFERRISGKLPKDLDSVIDAYKKQLAEQAPEIATRKAGEAALNVIAPAVPELVTGSADLTPSNNTKVAATKEITPEDFSGRYIHWGIREHGMAAACNGMAVHGGLIPSGASFLCFTDYARPALRLAALMKIRVVHVFTHDSIGLGEDGPTHQPVEHLASLRAMPNLNVFRPADAIETAECWELALAARKTPSVLSLSRQNLPTLERSVAENLSARGAYVLQEPLDGRDVTLLATGSEVAIALEAARLLQLLGKRAAVVSMPSFELFAAQPAEYRAFVLGTAPRVGVEAAIRFGWDRWLGETSAFVGMTGFGASAPAEALYEHFGITPQTVAQTAAALL